MSDCGIPKFQVASTMSTPLCRTSTQGICSTVYEWMDFSRSCSCCRGTVNMLTHPAIVNDDLRSGCVYLFLNDFDCPNGDDYMCRSRREECFVRNKNTFFWFTTNITIAHMRRWSAEPVVSLYFWKISTRKLLARLMLTNFSAPFAHGARIWLSKSRACTMSPPSFVVARALLQFCGQDTLIPPRSVRWTNFHSFLKSSRTSAACDLAKCILNSCDGRFVVCRKKEKRREKSRWWVCKYMKRKLEFENRIWECGWSLFSLEMFSPILTLFRGSFSSSSRFDRMFDLVPEVDLQRSNYRSFSFLHPQIMSTHPTFHSMTGGRA